LRGLGSLNAKHLRKNRTAIPIKIDKKVEKVPNIMRIAGLDLHPSSDLYSTRKLSLLQDKSYRLISKKGI